MRVMVELWRGRRDSHNDSIANDSSESRERHVAQCGGMQAMRAKATADESDCEADDGIADDSLESSEQHVKQSGSMHASNACNGGSR